MSLEPKTEAERVVFAEEGFRVNVQYTIQKTMDEQGIDIEELARRLGWSVSLTKKLVFSSDVNFKIKFAAYVFHLLGKKIELKVV